MAYNDTNRLNHDVKLIAQLREILAYCEQNGHKPTEGDGFRKRLDNIKINLHKRQKKGLPIPDEVTRLLKSINRLPTKAQLISLISSQTIQENTAIIESKEAELFRNSQNFRLLKASVLKGSYYKYGVDTYIRLVMSSKGTPIFNMLTDYLDWFVDDMASKESFNFHILSKYCGIGITAEDIQKINADSLMTDYNQFANGLSLKHLALIYECSAPTISNRINHIRSSFNQIWHAIDCFLNNDTAGLLDKMPYKLRQVHEFKQAHKIADIPTQELVKAGKCLQRFNYKDMEIAPVAYPIVFEQNLSKKKAVFPDIEMLQSLLGATNKDLYERVIMADHSTEKLKLLVDYVDYLLRINGDARQISPTDRENLCRIANAYAINGSYKYILQQMPDKFRRLHACQQIENMPIADLNDAFRWLYAGIKQKQL